MRSCHTLILTVLATGLLLGCDGAASSDGDSSSTNDVNTSTGSDAGTEAVKNLMGSQSSGEKYTASDLPKLKEQKQALQDEFDQYSKAIDEIGNPGVINRDIRQLEQKIAAGESVEANKAELDKLKAKLKAYDDAFNARLKTKRELGAVNSAIINLEGN
jgi:hypothetical protein